MQPSSHYDSTEVTVGGFKYKKTNATVENLFTLNSSIDNSIAYTEPLVGDFSNVSMWGWKNTSDSYYIQKSLVWGYSYKSSASATQDNAYNRVNKIEINYSNFNFSGVPYIVFAENGGGNAENYTFGYSAEATGVLKSGTLNSNSLITDFEVNKFVWQIGSLQGITTTEAGLYLDNGTETAEHNIDVEQFLANPSNYLITKFSITNNASWDEDNSQWRNAVANFCPLLLFDSSETGGLYSLNQGPSGGATVAPSATGNLGFDGKYSVELWNNRQDNSTAVPKMEHANKTFHRAFQHSYTLGSNADNLVIEPKADTMELTNSCELGYTGDFYIGHDTLNNTSSYLQCYQHDYYKMIKDYTGAAKSHLTTYKKYITTFLKGELVSKLLASCGVFFTQLSYSDLNTAGCTPTHMDIEGLHLGEMDDAGYTTGNWINGEDIADYDGINKEGSIIHGGFKPGPPDPDNPDKDDLDNMNTGFASTLSGCTKYFLMSPQDVNNLIEDYYTRAFAGSTLSESIISCYLCGAEPSEFLSTENSKIKIPTVAQENMFESQRSDYQLINAVLNEIPMGSIDVPRMNGDFHDFSPYTIYEVFLPFCGWCSLPDTVAGRKITARLEVDIRTMAGKGIIMMSDDNGNHATVAEMCANIGASAPFAVIEAGLERQAAVTAGIQTAVGVAQGISGGASGHSALMISGFGNAFQGVANGMMSSMANYTQVQGKAGDTSDFANGRQPYLKISWAKTDDVVKTTQFAHAFGYVCDAVGTLGNFKGFTVVSNPHVKINATQAEREEIKRLLEDGVVL